jgi:hypothetical protein
MAADWFQESPSGGPLQAWQTFYPANPSGRQIGSSHPPSFTSTVDGVAQGFPRVEPAQRTAKPGSKSATWFDDAVDQYDAYGRARLPSTKSGRRFIEWSQRSVNATLACAEPGCIANATLQVVNLAEEEFVQCRLRIGIHATDFDDDFSREHVEWFTVNNRTVNTFCNPKVRGCQAEAERALHPCVADLPLDHLMNKDGTYLIAGKISPMVDECPVDGNLLSGVATVTCMVRAKPPTPAPAKAEEAPTLGPATVPKPRVAQLRCAEPGCVATGTILLKEADMRHNKTCRLTVRIAQTDFDSQWEKVEWVKVRNTTVAEDLRPGRNPCQEAAAASGDSASGGSTNWTHFESAAAASNTTRAAAVSNSDDASERVLDAFDADEALAFGRNDSASLELGSADLIREAIAAGTSAGGSTSGGGPPANITTNNTSGTSSALAGTAATANTTGGITFVLVDGREVVVAEEAPAGKLPVSVKISDMVDECGSEGYLLNAEAVVVCE